MRRWLRKDKVSSYFTIDLKKKKKATKKHMYTQKGGEREEELTFGKAT